MNDQLQSTQDLNNVQEEITRIVGENNIVLFMKGNAHFPQCGFSGRAVEILRSLQAEFVTIDVLSNEAVRAGIKDILIGQPFRSFTFRESSSAAAIS